MKKYLLFLALLIAIAPIGQAMAAQDAAYATNDQKALYTIMLANTATAPLLTVMNSTNTTVGAYAVVPGISRILSYEVCSLTPGTGSTGLAVSAALWDNVTIHGTNATSAIDTGLFAESAAANTSSVERVFIYPKGLKNGLAVQQSPGTVVTIQLDRNNP
jgi:hypothetical protein